MPEREMSIAEALDFGTALAMKADHKSAIQIFKGVLIHEPDNFEAMQRLGTSLFELGLRMGSQTLPHTPPIYEALYWFWRSIKINWRHPLALMNYGLCLSQLGHADEGLPFLERAVANIDRAPLSVISRAVVYNNLGNTLERLDRHADALPILDKGIAIDASDPFPHYNRGIVLLRLNRHKEAIEALNTSMTLRAPGESRLNDADAYYNRAMAYLLTGDYANGFKDYEYRLTSSDSKPPNLGLDAAYRLKAGEDVRGKTVLVHCEQGLGDTIQSLRFLPQLVSLGTNVLLIAHEQMRGLVNIPGVTVLQPGQLLIPHGTENKTPEKPPIEYDRWIAIMSLPYFFGVESDDQIPPPWWFDAPMGSDDWEKLSGNLPPRPRVAVCWAGSFQHKNDVHRSIPLGKFAKLFSAPVNFVSVQQMFDADMETFAALKRKHDNLSAFYLTNFAETANVLLKCDQVVTVDTSVAHLAGTLGIPTWILIPKFGTDWRWQLNRTDTPWYRSVKLIRQSKIGDWDSVLEKVHGDLSEMAVADRAA